MMRHADPILSTMTFYVVLGQGYALRSWSFNITYYTKTAPSTMKTPLMCHFQRISGIF